MAIRNQARPTFSLTGIDRMVAALSSKLTPADSDRARHRAVPQHWFFERGGSLVTEKGTVVGGFPGSLSSMNVLARTEILVADRYLVIGEGTRQGFALHLDDIIGVDVVRYSRRENPAAVLHYQDGPSAASFALMFPGPTRGLTGEVRASRIARTLHEIGVPPLPSHAFPVFPNLAMSWNDARRHGNQPVLWTGKATGSVAGWFGSAQETCTLWLTEHMLFWTAPSFDGVWALLVHDMVEARDGVGQRIALGINHRGVRHDVVFDPHANDRSASDQRFRLMNVLASLGVTIRLAERPHRPWQRGGSERPDGPGR